MNTVDMMNELVQQGIEVLEELVKEEIKPLIDYREALEKKIANQAISEMKRLEEEAM